MARQKSPQEKKQERYDKDRRNNYGNNDKAADAYDSSVYAMNFFASAG